MNLRTKIIISNIKERRHPMIITVDGEGWVIDIKRG
jgi:hypothetical protein